MEWIKNNKFEFITLVFLLFLFVVMAISSNNIALETKNNSFINNNGENQAEILKKSRTVVVFHHPGCHACRDEIKFIKNNLQAEYPKVEFEYHDVTKPQEMELLKEYSKTYRLNFEDLMTPINFVGGNYLIGYEGDETTGKKLKVIIKKNYTDEELTVDEQQIFMQVERKTPTKIKTWFGEIDLLEASLPFLTVTLGLLDGFNPCAMWVLVYLISLIVGLGDRSKIWLIVGSFVLASGMLYFLFMTALLNVFLYIGYLRIFELFFGCIALYAGITSVKTWLIDKGQHVCKVTGEESRAKIKGRVKKLVESKLSVITVLGIFVLAFAVNSMEFVCSAALPAVYTNILSQADLPVIIYYLYILLYVIFFMLDDAIIFGLAAFAVEKYAPDKYVVNIQLIGGLIIFALGIIMVFFPQYLR